LFAIGDVAGDRPRAPTGGLNLSDKCVEKLTPSCYRHDGIAPRCQKHGNHPAEARRGAGNHSHALDAFTVGEMIHREHTVM
jgi:hypothetical protein